MNLKRPVVGALLFFILALGFRLYRLDTRSAWQDECLQYSYSQQGLFHPELVNESAVQGQPPLDASFQSVGLDNFGSGETGLRIHSVFLGALGVLFFYLLMCRLTPLRFPVALGALFLAAHPWLIRYSQEGRPITAAVALGVLYLFILFRLLQNTSNSARIYILFAIVQAWFILSAGFQPLVFIISSCAALIPFLFFKTFRTKTLFIYLSVPVSFLLAYPILKTGIDINSGIYLQEGSLLNKGLVVLKNIFSISFDAYAGYFKPLIDHYFTIFLAALIPGFIGLVKDLKKRSQNRSRYIRPLGFIYFLVFMLVYPLFFEAIFKSMVKFHVKTRYFLSFTPILAAVLVFGLYYAYTLLKPQIEKKTNRPVHVVYGIFLILFAVSFYNGSGKLGAVYKNKNRDWKQVYQLFTFEGTARDSAYIINIVPPSQWAPPALPADIFYYKNNPEQRVQLKNRDTLVADYNSILKRSHYKKVFLVFVYGGEKLKRSFFKGLPGIRYYAFNRVPVIQVFGGPGLTKNIKAVFQRLSEKLPRKLSNYLPHETLLYFDIADNRPGHVRAGITVLKQIDRNGQLQSRIKAFEKWVVEKMGKVE